MQAMPTPIALSFTSGCTSKRLYTRQASQSFSVACPTNTGIRKCVYAGSDESKLSWLVFRGYASTAHGGSISTMNDPRSPVSAAFRTVTFMYQSPITFKFDDNEGYKPEDEDVFDGEEGEDEGYGRDGGVKSASS